MLAQGWSGSVLGGGDWQETNDVGDDALATRDPLAAAAHRVDPLLACTVL